MKLIHCTAKLLKELGNPPLQSPDTEPNTEGLGNWYANLLRIDRRKCILFTNEKTLYSFLIPKVKKENLKNIEEEFLLNLNMNLQAEGFPLDVINKVMQKYTEIGFAKTASKTVLGAMNQLAFESEYHHNHIFSILKLPLGQKDPLKYCMSPSSKKKKKPNPLLWVVEPIQDEPSYLEKPMFGCQACYLHGRLVLALTSGAEPWNGLLIPTDFQFHESILKDFKTVKQHPVLKKWLYLREAQEDFESVAQEIVEAIRMNDQRFGVEPKERKR